MKPDRLSQRIAYNDSITRLFGKCIRLDEHLSKTGSNRAWLAKAKAIIKLDFAAQAGYYIAMQWVCLMEDAVDVALSAIELRKTKNEEGNHENSFSRDIK